MSTNISLDMILANFDKRGVKYKFYKSKADALTHNRNKAGANAGATTGGFGPLYGFVVHNFASDISDASSLSYLYSGDGPNSGKPGPLSQFALDDNGVVWIIGWGACTHTGPGDKETLDLAKRDKMPLDRDVIPDGSTDSGSVNPFFLAVEMLYGGRGPTAAQRTALIPFVAAVIEVLGSGYSGGSVVMHREFSTSRSDPTHFRGYEIRKSVNEQLSQWKSGTAPTPPPQENDMFTKQDQDWIEARMDAHDAYILANIKATLGRQMDPAVVAKAVAAALPSGSAVTDEQLETALRKVLGSVDNPPTV